MQGPHDDYLDGWRGLAIGLLLVGHFFPIPGINLGTAGVNLFFVLSGLLMARLLFVQQVPIATFYRRRVSRIFPAHYAFLAVIALWYAARGLSLNGSQLAAAAAFVINYVPRQAGDVVMPLGHIWSLCVEEHSYLVLSLVAVAARRGWVRPATAIGILSVAFALAGVWYWTRYSGPELDFVKWLRSEVSAYGIFASAWLMLVFRGAGMPRAGPFICPTLLLLGLAAHWWSVAEPVRTIVGVGAFAVAVNLLPAASRRVQSILEVRVLRQFGLWSFSIYLWQQPFYLNESLPRPLALALAVVGGIASFYLIENPTRRYLNRVWGKDARPSVPVLVQPSS